MKFRDKIEKNLYIDTVIPIMTSNLSATSINIKTRHWWTLLKIHNSNLSCLKNCTSG